MKKAFLFSLVFFISVTLFSQSDANDKIKKDNMGQTIKEVNIYYRDRIKEINADPALSKAERKEQRRELKDLKRERIHELNNGTSKSKNEIRAERRDARVKDKAIKKNKVNEKRVRENKGENN